VKLGSVARREEPTPQGAIQCGELDVKPLHRWAEEDLTKKKKKKKKCIQHISRET
jgi:hypothetical protein